MAFAGGKYLTNNPYAYYYLNSVGGSVNGEYRWWLMSPAITNGNVAVVYYVEGSSDLGSLSGSTPDDSWVTVRPVISLKSTVKVSGGDGTASNPYTVE